MKLEGECLHSNHMHLLRRLQQQSIMMLSSLFKLEC
jgi:hypothetical protein